MDTIYERNIEIGLMIGWEKTTIDYQLKWHCTDSIERLNKIHKEYIPVMLDSNKNPLFVDTIVFHEDISLLMDVYRFILNLKYQIQITSNHNHTVQISNDETIITHTSNDIMESMFIVFSDFAKQYNSK